MQDRESKRINCYPGEESTSSEASAGEESSSEDEPVLPKFLDSSQVPKPPNNSGMNMHRLCMHWSRNIFV